MTKSLKFGALIELIEDWLRNNQNHLILMHTMGKEEDEHENEFRRMLHEQYP